MWQVGAAAGAAAEAGACADPGAFVGSLAVAHAGSAAEVGGLASDALGAVGAMGASVVTAEGDSVPVGVAADAADAGGPDVATSVTVRAPLAVPAEPPSLAARPCGRKMTTTATAPRSAPATGRRIQRRSVARRGGCDVVGTNVSPSTRGAAGMPGLEP